MMTARFPKLRKWLLLGAAVVVGVIVLAVGLGYAFLKYSVLPLRDGTKLGDDAVTTIVTGYFGPVTIGAYLFELKDGGMGLVDTGSDPTATAIGKALGRIGRSPTDVRAIFLTHAHADHVGGVKAFPAAQVYILEPDIPELRRILERGSQQLPTLHGLQDDQHLDVFGTSVDVFAVPGHTPGSAAFLVYGVLFLGDSAAAAYNRSFQANTFLGSDPSRTAPSLRALSTHLKSRRAEIRNLAFGHQGSLDGLDPFLKWAATAGTN